METTLISDKNMDLITPIAQYITQKETEVSRLEEEVKSLRRYINEDFFDMGWVHRSVHESMVKEYDEKIRVYERLVKSMTDVIKENNVKIDVLEKSNSDLRQEIGIYQAYRRYRI